MQGDLADPAYFDFISFAQYVVLSDKMKSGKVDFIEKVGAEGETVSVHRDPQWTDNSILPTVHSSLVGDKILQFIYDTYPPSILPPTRTRTRTLPDSLATPHTPEMLRDFISDAQLLLDIFTFNSFALNMTIAELQQNNNQQKEKGDSPMMNSKTKQKQAVSTSASTDTSTSPSSSIIAVIRSQYPANLWSQQSLRLRGDTPINDFDIKMLAAFARKCNLSFEWLSTTVKNDIDVCHMIRVS
jgi:hypothetical protein